MADDALDAFNPIPKADEVEKLRGFRNAFLLVYYALADHAAFAPEKENYLRCWPSIETICRVSGLGCRTVFRALEWWEANDFIYRQRRPRNSSVYTFIRRRGWFKETSRKEDRAEAIRRYEAWILERQAGARSSNTEGARGQKPDGEPRAQQGTRPRSIRRGTSRDGENPRPSRDTGLKYPVGHPSEIPEVSLGSRVPGGTQTRRSLKGGTRGKGTPADESDYSFKIPDHIQKRLEEESASPDEVQEHLEEARRDLRAERGDYSLASLGLDEKIILHALEQADEERVARGGFR